jgi:predicted transcriptional regulator
MTKQQLARERTEKLKKLREDHAESVERMQAILKEQKQVQKIICQSIRDTAKTVPEIAAELNMPTHNVLWYLTAFKKYDQIVEEGMCGDYILYRRKTEK